MTRKLLLTVLAAIVLACVVSGCGDSKKLLSINGSSGNTGNSPSQYHQLAGIGAEVQLNVYANYSNNSTLNITSISTYTSSDPSVVTVSSSGLIEAVAAYCNWASATTYAAAGPIQVTATFQGQTTIFFIGVNSVAGCPGPSVTQ